jgi:4-oxalocrotonate tautomerase
MPIITVKVVKGVVLTNDAQKRDLLQKMTDTFISVVGEVARPYTYCIIEEVPVYEWSIAGRPLPDLPFLYGPEYAEMHKKANSLMRAFVEQSQGAPSKEDADKAARAEKQWGG